MKCDLNGLGRQLDRLRRSLPLSGHPRPMLLANLRARGAVGRVALQLRILDVFDMGESHGLLCRFVVEGQDQRNFVTPLAQIAFDRRHATAHAVAARCRQPRAGAA